MTYSAIILAAGEGKRTGLGINKVLIKVHEKRIIDYSLEYFKHDKACTQIILVVKEADYETMASMYEKTVDTVVIGGVLRQDSVQVGLNHVKEDYVLIHDGARPFIRKTTINNLLDALKSHQAVSLAVPIYDTVKRVQSGVFLETLNRDDLMLMQTPQGFLTDVLKEAYSKKDNKEYTCDVTLLKAVLDINAKVVFGNRRNIKLTTKEDIELLEMMLS